MSCPPGQNAAAPEAGRGTIWSLWPILPIALCLILGGATAVCSMSQSLWIDELHTAWITTGPWQQLVARSAVGNQTPIYFAWQWWLSRTFGHSEFCLRLTSLVAWWGCLLLMSLALYRIKRRTTQPATGQSSVSEPRRWHRSVWGLVCLTALDRQQIFFATEARPYMLMSLVVLIGWLWLDEWLVGPVAGWRSRILWLGWVGCCVLAMWLQPTAVLFVAAQCMFVVGYGGAQRWQMLLLAGLIIASCVWPMRYVLEPAWHSRSAWAAFASDLRWGNIFKQFPLAIVGLPGVVVAIVAWWQRARRPLPRDAKLMVDHMWLCGWAVPLALVVLLTALGIAPLMHARYLFAATLPLTLWTACMLSRWPGRRLVAICIITMILVQAMQQGSLSNWIAGGLPIAVRGEGWREAVAHIQRSTAGQAAPLQSSGAVQIYCAANLIEGGRPDFPERNCVHDEYLSLPLRTLYPVPQGAQIVSLLNDPRGWPNVITRAENAASARWLVVRASPAGLAKRLQLSGLRPLEQIDFGAVQLVRF